MSTTLRIKIVRPAPGTPTGVTETELVATTGSSGGSTAARDFLAMRRRQREARMARARRVKCGLVIAASAAMVVAGAFILPGWWQTRRVEAAAPLRAQVATPAPAPASVPDPAVAAVEAAPLPLPAPPAPVPTTAPEAIARAEAPAPASALDAPASPSECESSFGQQEWKVALESCGAAYQAAPDGKLALKIAHAHWARGDVAQAGEWASTARRMGNVDPDALVLVGHAQRRSGQRVDALASYREYLALAPRGWHARKVRWLVKRLTTRKTPAVTASADGSGDAGADADATAATTGPELTSAR